jgi:hypothetical protein
MRPGWLFYTIEPGFLTNTDQIVIYPGLCPWQWEKPNFTLFK